MIVVAIEGSIGRSVIIIFNRKKTQATIWFEKSVNEGKQNHIMEEYIIIRQYSILKLFKSYRAFN